MRQTIPWELREDPFSGEDFVYRADGDTNHGKELYSRLIDGTGSEVKLNDPLPAGGDIAENGFEIAPDSGRVVYYADGDTVGVSELYSRAIDGTGSEARLTDLSGLMDVVDFAISPDSEYVVYSHWKDVRLAAGLWEYCAMGAGVIAWEPIVARLAASYDGYWAIEYEEPSDVERGTRASLDYLRRCAQRCP